MMFAIIGLTGPAGVGKDTAAVILASTLGYATLAFADPIRFTVAGYYDWTLAELDRQKRNYGRVRRLLQVIGDHGRELQPDLYINRVASRLAQVRRAGHAGVVISDVRLPNEANFVRGSDGILVHLQRDGVSWAGDHISEQDIVAEPGDLVVRNPGTLDGFRGELLAALPDHYRRSVA